MLLNDASDGMYILLYGYLQIWRIALGNYNALYKQNQVSEKIRWVLQNKNDKTVYPIIIATHLNEKVQLIHNSGTNFYLNKNSNGVVVMLKKLSA